MRTRSAAIFVVLFLLSGGLVIPVPSARAYVGECTWKLNSNHSVTIFFIGNSSHNIDLHWSVVDKSGNWLNITDTPMTYSPSGGNFSVTIGPFSEGTMLQWVFRDSTTGGWYNLNGKAYSNWAYTVGAPAPGAQLVRMSVSTDKYAYPLSGVFVATIEVTNLQPSPLNGLLINSSVYNSNNVKVLDLPSVSGVSLGAEATGEYNVSASYSLSDANYVIVSNAFENGTQVGTANVPLVVLSTAGRAPLTLAFVWHNHQPIYLNLQGQFEQPWVQVHSGSDFVSNGSWYGAYFWEIYMLENHPGIKVTFNLQPSLLYQWNVTMHGFKYNGTYTAYPGGQEELSRDLAAVNATVAGYKALAADGQAEILTSPFYHPLSAILVQLGWSSDLFAQIEMGKNYTDEFMGVKAQGMWTPEMGFTMGMVPILQEAGMKYTVLDGEYHFVGAQGPSAYASMYQPFELEGANGSSVIVFFRDTTISNDLDYTWNDIPNPRVAGSDFIAAVANVYRQAPGGVLTIASDGENPICLASEIVSALDFNAIYGAIQSQSWLQTSTLGSIVASRPVTAKLTYVPNASWSGGFGLWIGAPPKTAIWQAITKSRATLVNLTNTYGASNPEIKKLWNYLYIAEGSDWEWQTPSGPAWFAMQGYRYAAAAAEYQPPASVSTTTSVSTSISTTVSTSVSAGGTSPWSYYTAYASAAAVAVVLLAVGFVILRRRRKS
jgi:hypothetical protein